MQRGGLGQSTDDARVHAWRPGPRATPTPARSAERGPHEAGDEAVLEEEAREQRHTSVSRNIVHYSRHVKGARARALSPVPAPGHTPGSVLVFVAVPGGTRYALLGDLAWQRVGVLEREERPWVWREAVDDDEAAVRRELVHVASLAAAFPDLVLVPAHDARAIAELPPWPPR